MSIKKVCVICEKEYDNCRYNSKFCSHGCRKVHNYKKTGLMNNLASGTVGAISEMICASDLMSRGFPTFRALSPSCLCDLVTIINEKVLRVEVRTGYVRADNKIYFNNKTTDNGRQDFFAVYIRNINQVVYYTTELLEINPEDL